MFLNTFAKMFFLAMMFLIFMVEAELTSSPTTTDEIEKAKSAVQLSTVCSDTVDSKMNLLFAKYLPKVFGNNLKTAFLLKVLSGFQRLSTTSGLYPELSTFLSAIRNKGKKELDRSCTNSRGDFMEYQTTEVNAGQTFAINHQMVIEKIKL